MAARKLTLVVSTILFTWFRLVSCDNQELLLNQKDGKSLPDLMTILKCGFDVEPMTCARQNAGRMLDVLEDKLHTEMKAWGETADAEVVSSGRQLVENEEMPSEAAQKLQMALSELINILQKSAVKSMARKKEESSGGGGVSSITITAGGGEDKKKKKKKKKDKPANIHIHQDQQKAEEDKGVLAEYPPENTDGTMIQGLWVDRDLEGPAKTRIKREQDIDDDDDDDDDDDEVRDIEDGRGKKKKKKKAILKLLLLGAVLKAKISLLLQLLSAHLQVKFFAIALAGLALNIARFWLDLKKGHQPQKVIYYEHAQHQHHYEHDDDHGSWGGWSRSFDEGPIKTKEEEIYNEPLDAGAEHGGYDESPYGGWSAPSVRSLNARKIRRRR